MNVIQIMEAVSKTAIIPLVATTVVAHLTIPLIPTDTHALVSLLFPLIMPTVVCTVFPILPLIFFPHANAYCQTLMNVNKGYTFVMQMPHAITLLEDMSASAMMGMLEMDLAVMVSLLNKNNIFVYNYCDYFFRHQ